MSSKTFPEFSAKEGIFPIRTNQVGYTTQAPKVASYVNSGTEPVMWELLDSGGAVVDSGMTTVYGFDDESGQDIHQIDFTGYTTMDKGYTLRVGDDMSHAFNIHDGIYNTIKYDALKYFYHNRSGAEIVAEYTGGANHSYVSDEQWARATAHLSDTMVTCWPDQDYTCDYFLDVSKGWYDAGDHGKYVVNGGISAWTLMNLYERNPMHYADGTLNIPESGNGVSDILDEVRWQMSFILGMQVPDGEELAGMAHHKIHNEVWTGLPYDPAVDTIPRYLVPPSTAATLNLAATAAQCARIWATIDADFSAECWTAAEKAWDAAVANPDILFSGADNENYPGGGPYDDSDVSDEFYWAAAELYITADALGDGDAATYETAINSYSDEIVPATGSSSMTWQQTAALGTISRAVVQGDATAQAAIISAADGYVSDIDTQGYRFPHEEMVYEWGSISGVTNNSIILGLAYDFTDDMAYVDAVGEALNYIFGRNTMDQSYVTGHGENPLIQPHHRFWAGTLSSAFPYAPPGAISGGPNSRAVDTGDPVAMGELPGCTEINGTTPPQQCFVDAIGSWSTNEITINWNSPFAWVLSFYDEVVNTAGLSITPTPAPTDAPTPEPTATPDPNAPTPEPSTVTLPDNLIVNSGFDDSTEPWWAADGTTTITLSENGEGCGMVLDPGLNPWDSLFGQNDLTIEQGVTYLVSFTGYSPEGADAVVNIGMQVEPFTSYASETFTLTTEPAMYSFEFTMGALTDSETNISFQIGGQDVVTVCVDDVLVAPQGEMPTETPVPGATDEPMPTAVPTVAPGTDILLNGDFEAGLDPWWNDSGLVTLSAVDGEACAEVLVPGANPWEALFGQNDLTIQQGETYDVSFTAYSPDPVEMLVNVGMQVEPFTSYAQDTFALTTTPTEYQFEFTMAATTDSLANLTFQIGGQDLVTVCVDDVMFETMGMPTAVSSNLNSATTTNILPLFIVTLIITMGCTAAWVRFSRS